MSSRSTNRCVHCAGCGVVHGWLMERCACPLCDGTGFARERGQCTGIDFTRRPLVHPVLGSAADGGLLVESRAIGGAS